MRYYLILSFCLSSFTALAVHAQTPASHFGLSPSPIHAEQAPAQAGPHGGSVKLAGHLRLETIVAQGGIQIYAYDRQGTPVSVDRGRGVAVLRAEGHAKRYRFDLLPDGKGGLLARVNLMRFAGQQVEVDTQLIGLGLKPVHFNEVATVPPNQSQQELTKLIAARPEVKVTTATEKDAVAIAKQKVCPVMDEPLGGMGTPIKVTVGDKPIFLCCKGCVKKVQAEPAKYLAMVNRDPDAEPKK